MKKKTFWILPVIADTIVVVAAISFLMVDPSDGWHRFTYYLAGMSFGWYCTVRCRQVKEWLR